MASNRETLLRSMQQGKFREISDHLSELSDDEQVEEVLVLLDCGFENPTVDQDAFENMLYFYRDALERICAA